VQEWRRLQERAREAGREKRIEEFVRHKDPAVLRNDGLRGLVMNPDLCESGDEVGRHRELDMKRKFVSAPARAADSNGNEVGPQ